MLSWAPYISVRKAFRASCREMIVFPYANTILLKSWFIFARHNICGTAVGFHLYHFRCTRYDIRKIGAVVD